MELLTGCRKSSASQTLGSAWGQSAAGTGRLPPSWCCAKATRHQSLAFSLPFLTLQNLELPPVTSSHGRESPMQRNTLGCRAFPHPSQDLLWRTRRNPGEHGQAHAGPSKPNVPSVCHLLIQQIFAELLLCTGHWGQSLCSHGACSPVGETNEK